MIFITQCDSPALWQTYLSDPASITMEGILIVKNSLFFLALILTVLALLSKESEKKKEEKPKSGKKPQAEEKAPVTPPQTPSTQPANPPQIQPGQPKLVTGYFPQFRVGDPVGVGDLIDSGLPKPRNPKLFENNKK
jgi:hypothetical protein